MKKDYAILRDLAKRTLEVAHQPEQDQRRRLWADVNSLRSHEVPIYILDPQGIWHEVKPQLQCEDPYLREHEDWLRLQLYHATFGDDYVTEKYITMRPVPDATAQGWATKGGYEYQNQETRGAKLRDYIEVSLEDIQAMPPLHVAYDEDKTRARRELLEEAFGGEIPIYEDRHPGHFYNLSAAICSLLGPENMMYQFYDNPEIIHAFAKKVSVESMQALKEAEAKGWFASTDETYGRNAEIQAMAYNHELANPNVPEIVPMKRHWVYDAAQEFEGASPQMFNDFLIEYTKPIYELFGLTSYGCCENLTEKLPVLMRIENLRRVAVTPWANKEKCAGLLTDRYVISWRPQPSEMVTNDFDPDRVTRIVREAREIFERYNCFWEVNLKDFLSVGRDPERLNLWVQAVRRGLE